MLCLISFRYLCKKVKYKIHRYMIRKHASKETIDNLIENAKSSILDSEHLLQNTELIKSRLSSSNIAHYLQLLFELLSGSLLGVYEIFSDMKNMLFADNVYAKRYHMQMINLSQYEWCVYLVGKDHGGIILKLINHLNEQHQGFKELEDIAQYVRLLGKQCDTSLRNITAHYDNPDKMYSMLILLNDEDIYAKRVGDQLLVHDMILQYISPILQTITETLCTNNKQCTYTRSVDKLSIIDVVNEKVADALHNKEKLDDVIAEQIANAWENIESHKKSYTICEKAIKYLTDRQVDYSRLVEIQALEELRWEVSFMQYDLACSMNTYLKAVSNAERSISFMRAYRIEISALSHLYGYNDEYRGKSIWNKIRNIPEFKSIPLSKEIEDELIALTSNFNPSKRNLYTHYRESAKLNISERWQCANDMNHPKELMQMLRLVTLCKKINHFLVLLISSMNSTEKRKNDEMLNPIRKIKELAQKNNQQDIVAMSDKFLSLFSLFGKKS